MDRYGFIKKEKKKETEYKTNWPMKRILKVSFIIGLIMVIIGLAILAGYLSWKQYSSNTTVIRIFKTFMASTFSLPYLTYYVIMGIGKSSQFKQLTKDAAGVGMLARNYIKNAPKKSLSGWQVEIPPVIVKK